MTTKYGTWLLIGKKIPTRTLSDPGGNLRADCVSVSNTLSMLISLTEIPVLWLRAGKHPCSWEIHAEIFRSKLWYLQLTIKWLSKISVCEETETERDGEGEGRETDHKFSKKLTNGKKGTWLLTVPSFKFLRFKLFPRKVWRKAYHMHWSIDHVCCGEDRIFSKLFHQDWKHFTLWQCVLQLKLRGSEILFVVYNRPIKHIWKNRKGFLLMTPWMSHPLGSSENKWFWEHSNLLYAHHRDAHLVLKYLRFDSKEVSVFNGISKALFD